MVVLDNPNMNRGELFNICEGQEAELRNKDDKITLLVDWLEDCEEQIEELIKYIDTPNDAIIKTSYTRGYLNALRLKIRARLESI